MKWRSRFGGLKRWGWSWDAPGWGQGRSEYRQSWHVTAGFSFIPPPPSIPGFGRAPSRRAPFTRPGRASAATVRASTLQRFNDLSLQRLNPFGRGFRVCEISSLRSARKGGMVLSAFGSGRSVVWLARLFRVQEVVSSNLTAPTILLINNLPSASMILPPTRRGALCPAQRAAAASLRSE